MKKKLLALLLATVSCTSLAMGVTACGDDEDPPSHVHNYEAGFLYANETEHWYECACGEKQDAVAHDIDANDDTKCTVCGVIPTGATESYMDLPVNTNPNFKYYGFFHSDGFGAQASYMSKIGALGACNVAMINSAWSPEAAVSRIEEARANGMKSIVSLHGLFGNEDENGRTSGVHYNEDGTYRYEIVRSPLLPNWQETFANWKNTLQEYIDDGSILMFYMDEPYWHGVMEDDFRTVTKYLQEQIPGMRFLHTMCMADIGAWVPTMVDGKPYPVLKASYNEYVTDVMYDGYSYWNDAERAGFMQKLKAIATNNQYIWGCGTGFVDHTQKDPLSTEILKASLQGMYREGIKEPRYAGIINFTFAGGDPNASEFSYAVGTNQYVNPASEYFTEDLRQLNCIIGNKIMNTPLEEVKDLISSFDDTLEISKVNPNAVWTVAIDRSKRRTGIASLKVTPNNNDGTPAVKFTQHTSETYDLTGAHHVTLWAKSYAGTLEGYALVISDAEGNKVEKTVPMGQLWTKYSIDVAELESAGVDVANAIIEFAFVGDEYTEKVAFNIDDVAIFNQEDEVFPEYEVEQTNDTIAFDNQVDLLRAVGNEAEWPRELDLEVKIDGKASLKVVPHAEWGTWPAITFQPLEGDTWDLSKAGSVSIWARNAGVETISGFGLMVVVGTETVKSVQVDMPAGEWVEFKISLEGTKYTNAIVKFGNMASNYTNRAAFNIDAFALGERENVDLDPNFIGFEHSSEIGRVGGSNDDVWCWPRAIDKTIAHTGEGSLKVSPHPSDGQWARVFFLPLEGDTWDLTGATKIRFWVYNNGEEDITTVDFTLKDSSAAVYALPITMTSKTWTQIEINLANASTLDLSAVEIFLGNARTPYTNRAAFNIDDFEIVGNPNLIGFESEADSETRIGTTGENHLFWPRAIDTEVKHSGVSSLKITPHAEWGTWPSINFLPAEGTVWDLTGAKKVTLWAYNRGTEVINGFYFNVKDVNGVKLNNTVTLAVGEWVKFEIILTGSSSLDLSQITEISLAQENGTYDNRCAFNLDDFEVDFGTNVSYSQNETADDLGIFVPTNSLYKASINTDAAFIAEGDSSFKFTCIQKWPEWKFSSTFIEWLNENEYTTLKLKIYFDAENAGTALASTTGSWGIQGLAGSDCETNVWHDVELNVADITTNTTVFQLNKIDEADFNVYIDAIEFVK